MKDENDLYDLISDELCNHRDFCNSTTFRFWEQDIATPELIKQGFEVGSWWTVDGDSFGPLVRAVELTKDGEKKVYTYG